MKRKNTREDKMKLLRKSNIQASPHTPITDRLGTAENKIRKEIAIMKKCRHAHVVRLLEVIDDRMKHKIYLGEHATSSMLLLRHQYLVFIGTENHLVLWFIIIRWCFETHCAVIFLVMEFLGGGGIKWRNADHDPILHVDQVRRICRDAILGLEYCKYFLLM